jgi:hypothetical protein
MPKPKSLSDATKAAIHRAVHEERILWEHHRLEEAAREMLDSPAHGKQMQRRREALDTLLRIQRELSDIDQQLYPMTKPLTTATAEPFGRVIDRLVAAEEHDLRIEQELPEPPPHRQAQCERLVLTLDELVDLEESINALARYAIHETDLLQIPSADGMTEENLRERLRDRNRRRKPAEEIHES